MKINSFKNTFYLLAVICLSLTVSCKAASPGNDSPAQETALPLNETALFLAGKPLPEESKLYAFTKSSYYKSYSAQISRGWSRFQEGNLKKMKTWWNDHAPAKTEGSILYPFSGPDIMNVLAFFPDGDTYTMFGLESPGIIPDPFSKNDKEMREGLNGISKSLNTIFKVNFFRTIGMSANLGNDSFNGIAGLIMVFLAKCDYTIVDARRVAIDKDSKLVDGIDSDLKIRWENPPTSKRIPGVEITFRKNGGKLQKVRYFMLNVIDAALDKHSPHFIPYLKKDAPYMTFIKSASYLMHNDKIKFTKIRAAVLDISGFIVQDDSGVPLRYLPESSWNVKAHGVYDTPIPLFANRKQNDLLKKMKDSSTGVLPFSYGYDYKAGKSNLLTAEKK